MKHAKYLIFLLPFIFINGCSGTKNSTEFPQSWESLQATLWVQHAAEFEALTLSTYRAAAQNIDSLLIDSTFSAIPDQSIGSADKPPAIILDVDETVLDNSPFQARLIRNKNEYTPELWAKWVNEENALSIPGALNFTKNAARKGITVFYVTNRDHSLEEPTRNNLRELGFPLKQIDSSEHPGDVILTNREHENWSSSKIQRRKDIAKNYRVIMMFGDNLNDFIDAEDKSVEERSELLEQYGKYFGHSWYMLPNPVYGSWEASMMKPYEQATERDEILKRKIELLRPDY